MRAETKRAAATKPLDVVGLLSGGKDSCYNLCHCAKLGHNIVALATLTPPEGKDELDSYMYQTVGHDAVHLIAEAMRLPLYRMTISGSAINQTSIYGDRLPQSSRQASTTSSGSTVDAEQPHDETEDLYHLLRLVKENHPNVNAVSVGAILSNYQRVRVEHVARRADIDMVPLSFLWQRDQRVLLDEMCSAGMHSILIKVAGAGLEERDLGKSLAQMRPKLHKLNAMYQAHICGEGGEYETLTLDCPLFKSRIVLDKTTVHSHGEASSEGVFYLTVQSAHLEAKNGDECDLESVSIPAELDHVGKRTEAAARMAGSSSDLGERHLPSKGALPEPLLLTSRSRKKGRWVAIGPVIAGHSDTLAKAFRRAFAKLIQQLSAAQLSTAHLQHVNVYIASQEYFAELNKVYMEFFGVAPPSRACVATNLSSIDAAIVIDAIALDDGCRYGPHFSTARLANQILRRNLHVQGLSHWASANIGPYSQAVDAMARISIAGQIGLLPTTLALEDDLCVQMALSLQHARRILKVLLESRADRAQGWVESCICWIAGEAHLSAARSAWLAQASEQGEEDDAEVESGCHDDEWDRRWLGQAVQPVDVPFCFVVVSPDGLPRGAAVEWQLTAHSGDTFAKPDDSASFAAAEDDEDEDDEKASHPCYDRKTHNDEQGALVRHQMTTSSRSGSSFGVLLFSWSDSKHASLLVLPDSLLKALHVRIFYSVDCSNLLQDLQIRLLDAAITFIPVCACYDLDLRAADIAIVWQGVS